MSVSTPEARFGHATQRPRGGRHRAPSRRSKRRSSSARRVTKKTITSSGPAGARLDADAVGEVAEARVEARGRADRARRWPSLMPELLRQRCSPSSRPSPPAYSCRMSDEGNPIHYSAIERGRRCIAIDGAGSARSARCRQLPRAHPRRHRDRDRRRAALRRRPEVQRTSENLVTLNITAEQAARLATPERGPKTFRRRRAGGRLSRFLGGGWKRE